MNSLLIIEVAIVSVGVIKHIAFKIMTKKELTLEEVLNAIVKTELKIS